MHSKFILTISILASFGAASPYVGAPSSFLRRDLPVVKASFTWNNNCGSTVACGPAAAGVLGVGAAAINTLAFQNPNGAIDGSGNTPIVNGVGAACGACWHLQPQTDWYPSNGKSVGKPIVVKINDQCPDGGYCDQTVDHPTNTGGYDAPVHFDLCATTGAAQQLFGEIEPGVIIGLAQFDPDCVGLNDGQLGASLGEL
ncbi:MAG: hypothetical protein LQ352_000193 [Teloschistes flavicans]|nr:MAG: hypothetical protein LQ352_000193 [Teloschistes flavicans]